MGWEEKAAKRKAQVNDAIPQEWRLKEMPTTDSVMSVPKDSGILSADELAITESSATELVRDLAAGKLTAVAVTTAFLKRAALAHQTVTYPHSRVSSSCSNIEETNCLHAFYREFALERAKYLDEYMAKNKKPIGPLHGLPVSLKDQCRIKVSNGVLGWKIRC